MKFLNIDDANKMKNQIATINHATKIIDIATFAKSDNNPQLEEFYNAIDTANDPIVIKGLSTYLKLMGQKDFVNTLKNIFLHYRDRDITILCYQSKDLLLNLLNSDMRIKQFIDYKSDKKTETPKIIFHDIATYVNDGRGLKGIDCIISAFEGTVGGTLDIYTKHRAIFYANSVIEITDETDSFEVLRSKIPQFSNINSNVATKHTWDIILKGLKNDTWSAYLQRRLGTQDYMQWITNYIGKDDDVKTLIFLALKTLFSCVTLDTAAKVSNNTDDFIFNIYSGILDEDYTSKSFWDLYNERKKVLYFLGGGEDNIFIDKYLSITKQKQHLELYYLTDNTTAEKRRALKIISNPYWQNKSNRHELLVALSHVWHDLYNYLQVYDFGAGKELFTNYFSEYKFQKVTNTLYDDFLNLVNNEVTAQDYIKTDRRCTIVNNIDKSESSKLYFVDSLGMEYISYIISKAKELDLSINVKIARADLPTITSCNNDFIDGWILPIVNKKELDKIKHEGVEGFDYQNERLPFHLIRELQIIDEVLNNIKSELYQGNILKAFIISDHGSSRLCVLYNNFTKFQMVQKGQHSGRCCPISESEQSPSTCVTQDNGFWCISNYDRFSGGRASSVESHGGATLEEVLVPIIEFSKGNIDMPVVQFLDKGPFIIKRGEVGAIKFFASVPLKEVGAFVSGINLDNKCEVVTSVNNGVYEVLMDGVTKSGDYTLTITSSGNKDIVKHIKAQKQGFSENDMGI